MELERKRAPIVAEDWAMGEERQCDVVDERVDAKSAVPPPCSSVQAHNPAKVACPMLLGPQVLSVRILLIRGGVLVEHLNRKCYGNDGEIEAVLRQAVSSSSSASFPRHHRHPLLLPEHSHDSFFRRHSRDDCDPSLLRHPLLHAAPSINRGQSFAREI
jgi:hypothetical protein